MLLLKENSNNNPDLMNMLAYISIIFIIFISFSHCDMHAD